MPESQRCIGSTLRWIVLGQWPVDNARRRPSERDDLLREISCGVLIGGTHIDRSLVVVSRRHQAHKSLNHIVHVAERACVRSVAKHRDVVASQRLHYEGTHYSPVIGVHSGTVSVEDSRHLDSEPVLPVVVEEERFCATFALVVAATSANGIDVAPVVFGLWTHCWVAVDLARRRLKNLGFQTLRQAECVDGPVHAGLGRLHWVELVVDWRRRGTPGCRSRPPRDRAGTSHRGVGPQTMDGSRGAQCCSEYPCRSCRHR